MGNICNNVGCAVVRRPKERWLRGSTVSMLVRCLFLAEELCSSERGNVFSCSTTSGEVAS